VGEGIRSDEDEVMSAGLAVAGTTALAGISCGAIGALCCAALCSVAFCGWAAKAEAKWELRRIAETPHNRHDTAAMVRTDERRKNSSG
jgi:hypothetical protein